MTIAVLTIITRRLPWLALGLVVGFAIGVRLA